MVSDRINETYVPPKSEHAPETPAVPGRGFDLCDYPVSGQGAYMTPIDEFSGIPLPLDPESMQERSNRYKWDDHHPWHERNDPRLLSVSGMALRASRVQRANYETHHMDYHARNFRGPAIPADPADHLRPIILAAAGYVPGRAIAFAKSGEPYVKDLTIETRRELWNSGTIRVERPRVIRDYLWSLIEVQDLSDIRQVTIDEFLGTSDEARRLELGNSLLSKAARRAVEGVRQEYTTAYKEQQLPPGRSRLVSRFALSAFGTRPPQRLRVLEKLSEQLAA